MPPEDEDEVSVPQEIRNPRHDATRRRLRRAKRRLRLMPTAQTIAMTMAATGHCRCGKSGLDDALWTLVTMPIDTAVKKPSGSGVCVTLHVDAGGRLEQVTAMPVVAPGWLEGLVRCSWNVATWPAATVALPNAPGARMMEKSPPFPDKGITSGFTKPVLLINSAPFCEPASVGLKFTCTSQVLPGSMLGPQVLLWENPAPVTLTPVTVTLWVPELIIVSVTEAPLPMVGVARRIPSS